MNYLNILDKISDRSKIYFLPINSTGVISYNNSLLTFHIVDLAGNTITTVPGQYDNNGVYFEPVDLVGIPSGTVYGFYLEVRTRDNRDYYPGQTVLYMIVSMDAKLSILRDIPPEYLKTVDKNTGVELPFNTVAVQTLPDGSQGFARIINRQLILGIPQGKTGSQGPQGIQGEAGPQGRDGRVGDSAYQTAVNYGFKGSELDWLKSLTPDTSTYTKYDQYHSYVDSVEKLRKQLNDFKNAELTVSLERARPHTLSILTDNDGNSYYEFDNGCIINFKTLGKNADVTGYGKSDNQYITQFNYQRVDSDLRSIMSGALTLDAIKNASPTDFYAFADMVVSNPVNNNLDKYLFETGYISNQNHGPSSQAGELNFIKVLYQLGLISEDNLGPVYHVAKKP